MAFRRASTGCWRATLLIRRATRNGSKRRWRARKLSSFMRATTSIRISSQRRRQRRRRLAVASRDHSGLRSGWLLSMAVALAFAQTPAGRQPASVEGHVTNGLTGEPLAKARVTLTTPPEPTSRTSKEYGAITDADGKFSWAAVEPGTYAVAVSLRGFVAVASQAPTSGLDVQPGATVRDVSLKMAPEAVISGRVVDAQGDPVERVTVTAYSAKSRSFFGAGAMVGSEFSFTRLPAGKYTLQAMPQD